MKKTLQERLKALKEHVNPMNAMSGAVKLFLPQLGATLKNMETPESEGGLLKEGEDKMGFLIIDKNEQVTAVVCAMKKVPEGMLITRTISDNSLEDVLKENL